MSVLHHALAEAAAGRRVFPLSPRLTADDKYPAKDLPWKEIATTDKAQVERWFGRGGEYESCGYGIATGAGFMVFDADVKNGARGLQSFDLAQMMGLDPFRVVETPSGGLHAYVTVPDGQPVPNGDKRTKALLGFPGVDIRGDGGFVVGPGSVRDDGKSYAVKRDDPAATGAGIMWLVERLRTRVKKKQEAQLDIELDKAAAVARAIEYLRTSAPEAVQGSNGDGDTYRVAAAVKDFGISEPMTLDLMLEHWNEQKAFPAWDPFELEKKVENAFAYGTSPAGVRSAEAEFDAVDLVERAIDPPLKRRGLYRVEFDAAAALATTSVNPSLIDDILDQHSFAVIYGPSNSGKTFLALSLAYHVAAGQPWAGHPVERGAVLYVVAEGGRGINKRIAALKKHYAPAGKVPLDIIPCPVDLRSSDADVKRIVKLAVEAAEAHGQKILLVVIDTLSRALAGGDENASTDMGAFVMNIDKLRLATSATVLVVHHTGKNVANGARGWSGLRAAIDTEIEVGEGGVISFEKQRDLEMIPDLTFRLEIINLGPGPSGKDVTSCVLHPISRAEAEFEAQMDLPLQAREYFDCLAGMGAGPVEVAAWDKAFNEYLHDEQQPAVGYRTTRRLRATLKDAGWVAPAGKTKWRPISNEVQE